MTRAGTILDAVSAVLVLVAFAYAPIALGSTSDLTLTGLRLIVTATVACTAASIAAGHRFRWPARALLIPWAALLAATWISVASSRYPLASWTEAHVVTTYLVGLLLGHHHATRTWWRRAFVAVFATTMAVMTVYGLVQDAGFGVTPTGVLRLSSTYYNSNHYAGFLDLAVPAALAVAVLARRWWARAVAASLAALGAVNLLLTFSRGAWVGVAAGVVVVTVWAVYRYVTGAGPGRRTARWFTVVAVTAAAVVVTVAAWAAASRIVPGATRALEHRAGELAYVVTHPQAFDRAYIVVAGIQVVREAPWTGVGPSNYVDAVTPYRPQPDPAVLVHPFHKDINYAHNDVLQVATESGIPAALAFMIVWGVIVLRPSPRGDLLAVAARAGLVAIAVHGLVDGNLTVIPSNAWMAYVLAGVVHAPSSAAHAGVSTTSDRG